MANIMLDALALPDGLRWPDRYDFSVVKQAHQRSLTGSLIIHQSTVAAGRPIVLVGGERHTWLTRSEIVTLKTKVEQGVIMTLSYYGTSYPVRFDYSQEQPMVARPLWPDETAHQSDAHWVIDSLRFITV